MFAEALGRAVKRGVEVRVLIDSVGSRYTFPSIVPRLRRRWRAHRAVHAHATSPARSPTATSAATARSWSSMARIGFTGGLNIREGAMLSLQPPPRAPLHDTHFRLEGPVVAQLQEIFVEDWAFTTGEILHGEPWFARA